MSTWVKLHRKILYNPIFKNAELYQLYSFCLLRAGYEEGEAFEGDDIVKLEKGQFVTGRIKLSEALGQNPSTIYKRLKKLEKLGYIELKSNNKNTIVTVVNWELYQAKNEKVTTNGQQSNTNKKLKNFKNEKEKYIDDFFEKAWKLYPNKKDKGSVSKTQKQKLYKLGDEFIRCVERYAEEKKGTEKKFIKHGSRFFNNGYIDYLDENYSNINSKESEEQYKDESRYERNKRLNPHQYDEDGDYIGWK